jgi:hypothetical protein
MTLCLAWKIENDIFFASDSRITRKVDNEYIVTSNSAPKIFSVPIRIYDAHLNLVYDKDWGFCLAGGYIAGSGYADTLSEVLSNIQIANDFSFVDYKNILNIAFNIYEQISKQLVETGNKEALSKILISGICPQNVDHSFAYEFGFEISHGIIYYSKEVKFNEYVMHLIGDQDAIDFFKENLKKHLGNEYFRLLKTICKNPDLKTVGGHLQAGILKKNHPKYFSIFGILESELEFDGDVNWSVKNNWYFRSIELKPELFEGNIHIRKAFLMPFEKERLELIDEADRKSEEELKAKIKKQNKKDGL